MDLREGTDAATRDVRVEDDADQRSIVACALGARLEVLEERVVDDPGLSSVRRDRRGGVVATVTGSSDVAERRPGRAPVRGRGEHDVLVVSATWSTVVSTIRLVASVPDGAP